MDTITLKRKLNDEPSPRYYSLAGGEFTAMKDAVKAAGGAFESYPLKVWKIKKEGIAALKAAGYTVELLPFVRMAAFNERTIYDGKNVTCEVGFEYVNTDGKYRWFPGDLRVKLGEITDADVQAANAAINAALIGIGMPASTTLNRYTAVRKICREAAEAKAAEVIAAFEAASGGKRTAEAIQAGFVAMQEAISF